MNEEDPLRELFNTLIDDETEQKIMDMIISGYNVDKIVEKLVKEKSG